MYVRGTGGPWHTICAALLSLLPVTAAAQVQVNQTFNLQGPSPSIGSDIIVQSGDVASSVPPNSGTVAGAVEAVVTDPSNSKIMYLGTPGGGIWATFDGGTKWAPLTDNQATLSISSLGFDPTDPSDKTLIAGTGLTSNGCISSTLCLRGNLQNGLLYTQDGGVTWTSLGGGTGGPLTGQTVVGVAARGQTILAATFNTAIYADNTYAGALYRSTDGGAHFSSVSVAGCSTDMGCPPTRTPWWPVSTMAISRSARRRRRTLSHN